MLVCKNSYRLENEGKLNVESIRTCGLEPSYSIQHVHELRPEQFLCLQTLPLRSCSYCIGVFNHGFVGCKLIAVIVVELKGPKILLVVMLVEW